MIESIPIVAGLLAAVFHVLTGPDHLAAVTPLTIELNHKPWRVGWIWGWGNLLGMFVIGLLYLVFKEVIAIEAVSEYSEKLVGFLLLAVGAWGILQYYRTKSVQDHVHHPDPKVGRSTLGIGFVHGLAGVAHFLLLLPVLGFATHWESISYILGFAIGTVASMTSYTYGLYRLKKVNSTSNNYISLIRIIGGCFAIVIGFYWIYQTF